MLYGLPFILNPPAPQAPEWKLMERIEHFLHNHTLLQIAEVGFHSAYLGLAFVDGLFGTKFYMWTMLPLLLITLMHLKGE